MKLLSGIRERVRGLLYWRREERELEEELDFHLRAAIEENLRRGMSPREARRRAAIRLGGREVIRESVRDARGTRLLEDLLRDIRFAGRRLFKERGFSVPIVATIAVGIAVTSAVFALFNAVLLRPLPYPDSDRLVQVGHSATGIDLAVTGLSPGTFVHYRRSNRSFREMAVYLDDARILSDVQDAEQVRVALVSESFFDVMGTTPSLGRLPVEALVTGGVLIGHDLWVRRYGSDRAIVGRTIEINRERYRVTGVARPGFHFPHPETQVWMTGHMEDILTRFGDRAGIGGFYLGSVARLEAGQSTKAAEEDLNGLISALPGAFPDVTREDLEKLALQAVVAPLKEAIVGPIRPGLLVLAATAGILLLMTWVNASNLCLLRGERLRGEIAIERALGAGQRRLLQRFLSESLILALLGGLTGFAFAQLAVQIRFGFDATQIPRLQEMILDAPVAGFAVTVALVSALLLCSVYWLGVSRSKLSVSLSQNLRSLRSQGRGQGTRKLLVAAQVALALVLLISSALLVQTYSRLARFDLGFRAEGAVTFLLPLPPQPYPDRPSSLRLHTQVLENLRRLPGVEAVESATVAAFPLTPVPNYFNDQLSVVASESSLAGVSTHAIFSFATAGYFRAMGIPILQGHTFAREAAADLPEAILSEHLARELFPGRDPLGSRIRSQNTGSDYRVAGVVGDVPSRSIREGASNILYLSNPAGQAGSGGGPAPKLVLRNEQYVVRSRLPLSTLLPAIGAGIDQVDSKLAMTEVGTLENLVSGSLATARLTMLLLLVASATALFLSLIGIYSVLSYSIRHRRRELGVRLALGASPANILTLVLRQGVLLSLGGIAAGLPAAFALTRLLRSLLYQVSPSDPAAFLAATLALFLAALIATCVPARQAARVDPVQSLKAD